MQDVEPWKLKMIARQARRFGFFGVDIDDAVQDTVLAVSEFKYDVKKAAGGSEEAIFCLLVNRVLSTLGHRRARREAKDDQISARVTPREQSPASHLRLDIESVAERLPAGERRIFDLVAKNVSRENIVARLKITRHAVDTGIKNIRRKMERAGLNCE